MALPTLSSEQVEDIYTATFNKKLPGVQDNVYGSNPTLGLIKQKSNIVLDGGKQVEQPMIYGKLNGGWYGVGDSFNTDTKNTKTAFILPWRRAYVNITIEGMDDLQNAGSAAVFSHANQKLTEAQLKMKDILGSALFGSSNDGGGKAMSGFEEWLDDGTNFGTIGGINRNGGDDIATAAQSNYDATAGSWTIPNLQTQYGEATLEDERPDLILTTQTLWNAMFNRVQPAQRYDDKHEAAKIGFEVIRFQRAAIVVDSHVQSGRVYGAHTKTTKLFVHTKRQGNKLRGPWMNTSNKDERINQVWFAGNMVVASPRLSFQQRGRTA